MTLIICSAFPLLLLLLWHPIPGLTRFADLNRLRDALIPLKCSTPFRPDLIGISEPDSRCSVTTISLYQNHLSKTCGSDFNLGQAHKHLQIQCNSFTKYAFNQKWHFMLFTTYYLKSYSDIGTKIISELESFCLQNNVMLKMVRMHVTEHTP